MKPARQGLLLEARGIVMSFGGLKALNRVDIQVGAEEILGLIGPNGSGKTTFFNVVTGLYRPTEGSVLFDGEELVGLSPQEIAARGVIRTFQSSRLWFELSILDNVLLGMYLRPKPGLGATLLRHRRVRRDFAVKVEEALRVLSIFDPDLARDPYRRARDLPLVDRRRVEIARAMVANPRLLLLDEPAVGMDVSETRQLMGDVRKLKETRSGLGVIVIEHDMTVISSIAERVVVLNFGQKLTEGTFERIREDRGVREAYLGKG